MTVDHSGRMGVTRRDLIRLGGGAVLGSGCARRAPVGSSPAAKRPSLARVLVSPERVIRTVAGLRPYRPSGFVIRSEPLGRKTLIHNYGHGGAGITLSWGCAEMAAELAMKSGSREFAVIGCGVIGLSTARRLQRHGASVTIYSKDTPPRTTSNIAGGWWAPTSVFDRSVAPAFVSDYVRASRLAFRAFQDMTNDYYGVRWLPTYSLSRTGRHMFTPGGSLDPVLDLFKDARDLTEAENPFAGLKAHRVWTMLIEPPIYLNALLRDFLLEGGKLIIRDFSDAASLNELREPAIVNCTGLGARQLFSDKELIPVRGQLAVLVPQPEVNYCTIANGGYMFPRRDGILLGGTFEPDVWSLEPEDATITRIIDEHRKLFSTLS